MGLSLLRDSSPPRLLMRPWASLEGKKPGAMTLLVMCLVPSSTAKLRARCFSARQRAPKHLRGSKQLTFAAALDALYMMVPCSPT
jgi:hypothetical protein